MAIWRKRCAAVLALLVAALSLAGCAATVQSDPADVLSTTAPLSGEVTTAAVDAMDEEENEALEIDTYVILNDDATTINGAGAAFEDGRLTISAPGVYSLKGTLSDGQIYVDTDDESAKVKLVFDGVDLYCSESAPVYVARSPKETQIILAEGSENKLSDNADRMMTQAQTEDDDFATAVIYSKDDLQLEGDGRLTVEANFQKGIFSRDDLQIKSGVLVITAADDGLRGKDGVQIAGGTLKIKCGGDGIRTSNKAKGNLSVSGGDITIESAQDCVQAMGDLSVSGGTFRLQSGGGYQESLQTQTGGSVLFGGFKPQQTNTGSTDDSNVSAKGLKAGGNIAISGGTFLLDCLDDAVHADENVAISGGVFRVSTNDDGIHADKSVAIAGGELIVEASYEGLEGNDLTISGGTLDITAQDDGINAASANNQNDMTLLRSMPANGDRPEPPTDADGKPQMPDDGKMPEPPTDADGMPQPPGSGDAAGQTGFGFRRQGGPDQVDESCIVAISGGTIRVDASGDGIDANGTIIVSGGAILVFGPINNGNGALDYAGDCTVTDGTLCALGSAGMAQGVSGGSVASLETQVTLAAGDTLTVTGSDGSEVYAVKLEKQAAHLVLAAKTLRAGQSYTLRVNGSEVGAVTAK